MRPRKHSPGRLIVPQANSEAVCKVLSVVANKTLDTQQRLNAMKDSRQLILAWGLKQERTAEAIGFLSSDSIMSFALASDLVAL